MRLLWIGLASLAAVSTAQAQSTEEVRLKPKWQALDADHDGKVTLAELPPMLAGGLRRSDIDGDGAISLTEYVAFDHDPAGAARMPLPDNVRLVADLPYAGTADPRQSLDVYLPKHPTVPGPLPVIAYVHGGGWMTGSKEMARSQVMALVNSGRYAAVSIAYRLAWQVPWPAQIFDVKAGVRWIRGNAAQYGFDPKRICALGPSAGGHLVSELGTTGGVASVEGTLGRYGKQSSRVQCVIDMLGPIDLAHLDRPSRPGEPSGLELMLGSSADAARNASPNTFIDPKDPPFLIIHGTKDPQVPYQEAVKFDAALRAAGVPVLFQTVEGGGHGDFGKAQAPVADRMRLFLEQQFYDSKTVVPTDTLTK
jgi:acetyl esterase/lipase